MEGFTMLSVLSLAMFLGSYISGSVPLAMSFSESKLRFVSIFGAGLLVGTALAVIIPEGVQSIYEADMELHNHQFHKEAEHILEENAQKPPFNPPRLPPKEVQVNLPDPKAPVPEISHEKEKADNPADDNGRKKREDLAGQSSAPVRKLLEAKEEDDDEKSPEKAHKEGHSHHEEHEEHKGHSSHGVIGVALVAGFVFMLVVDQITRSSTGRAETSGTRSRYKITATVGLVVHAAADGIALGAASSSKHSEIQFIVFIAIMLHKAPAAFGLVTFLMVEGLEKIRIRKHLLVFSLAAPLMAVITYMGIAQGGSETLTSMSSTGVLMLFSAGTFLYVATVHILPELVNSAPKTAGYHLVDSGGLPTSNPNASTAGHSHHASNGFKLNEVFALIVGAGVPAFLSIGHSH